MRAMLTILILLLTLCAGAAYAGSRPGALTGSGGSNSGDYYGNSGGSGFTNNYNSQQYYYGRRPVLPQGGTVNNNGRIMTPAPDGSGLWQEKSTGRTCWGMDCR